MALSIGIIFGLLAMLSLGISDFLAKGLVERIGAFRTFLYQYLFGTLVALVFFLIYPVDLSLSTLLIVVLVLGGLLNALGYVFFYKGMAIEKLSILSPIVACNPIVVILLSFVILREVLSLNQGLGVVLLVVGLILVSIHTTKFKITDKSGVFYGFLTMLSWGIALFVLGYLIKESYWFPAVVMFRIMTWFTGFIIFNFRNVPLDFPKKGGTILLILIVGLLDVMGVLSFGFGVSKGLVSVVGPISALYPAVTLVLARVFIKEKLLSVQKIGVLVILIGLVVVSL